IPVGLFAFATLILFAFHVLINNQSSLRFILDKVKKITGTDIQSSQFAFNGFTGSFTGESLRIVSNRKKFELELGKFKLKLKTVNLILGQVQIDEIETDKFVLKLLSQEASNKPKLKNDPNNLINELIDILFLSHADIQNIQITSDNKFDIHTQRLQLNAGRPLFFSSRPIRASISQTRFQSIKGDFFINQFDLKGEVGQSRPNIEGVLQVNEALLALPKKPNPWASNPEYEASLEPLIRKYYGDTLPDNRVFAHINSIDAPFTLESSLLKTGDVKISAFNSKLTTHISYANRKIDIALKSDSPLYWPLLPFGRANLRQAYENCDISLVTTGKYINLHNNKISGAVKIKLYQTRAYKNGANINLDLPFEMNHGQLKSGTFKLGVGAGQVDGLMALDLVKKTINTSIKGNNLDSQAGIRLFSSIDFPGTANLAGKITGSLTNPLFDLKINSPGFAYESLYFGTFDGALKIENKNLVLNGVSSLENTGKGTINLNINNVFKSSEQEVNLKTSFENLPAGALMKSAVLKGTVSGHYNLQKKNQFYTGNGDIHFADGSWYAIPIKKIDTNLKQEAKYLNVENTAVQWNDETPLQKNTRPLIFHFMPDGYVFEGPALPNAAISGNYKNGDPFVNMQIKLGKSGLDFLKPLIQAGDTLPVASGEIKLQYALGNPENTILEARVDAFEFKRREHALNLLKQTNVGYHQKKIEFKNTQLSYGKGKFELNGILNLTENSSLKIKGTHDIETLTEFMPFLVEGSGMIDSDLEWVGPYTKPQFKGNLKLNQADLRFRLLNGELNGLVGLVKLDGDRVTTQELWGLFNDSPFQLNGWFDYNKVDNFYGADLHLKASELSYSKSDKWRSLFDLNVDLTGSNHNLKLSGLVNLIEGTFFQDYSLSQFILKPIGVNYPDEDSLPEWAEKLALNINLKSSGEFLIDNNIGRIALKGDLNINGPVARPSVLGTIDVLDGDIKAFGLNFENASGFINFDAQKPLTPYIDFQATQEIQNYLVKALIRGYQDNLSLSFESQPALNHNEVISLIAFGQTPDQLNQSNKNLFSRAAIASQLVSLLQGPIGRMTHLDIVKLEADNFDNEALLTRFSIGKRISDRVAFAFTTDLSLDEAFKGVILEYQFLDNLLLKGSKDTGSRYRFDLTWRLEAY
ncbi:MAG: hypothetical protein ACD_73C00100G0001, partial [uncultured bacterium]